MEVINVAKEIKETVEEKKVESMGNRLSYRAKHFVDTIEDWFVVKDKLDRNEFKLLFNLVMKNR